MTNAPERARTRGTRAGGISDHPDVLALLRAIVDGQAAMLAELRAIRCAGSTAVPAPLLLALGAYYGNGPFTVAEVQSDTGRDRDLATAVEGIGGTRQLGVALRALAAAEPAGGFCLIASGRNRRNATEWRVVTEMTSVTFAGDRANVRAISNEDTAP